MGQNYLIIPYNDAILASAPQLIGRKMDFVFKVLYMSPSTLCRKLERSYEDIFKEKMDYSSPDTTINCLKRLNDPLENPPDEFLNVFKKAMIRYEKNEIFEFLHFIFGPKKNNFKIVDKDYCYHEHLAAGSNFLGDNYQPGWTSSKVLLIKTELYNTVKNDIE